MADTKITQLQPPQAGYPVVPATDVLPIVVIADPGMATSGSTRKVTVNQLLGAGGTATLASATITGDLTVDTSTLKVDSANNRVGILTASPAAGYALDVRGILAAGNSAGTIIGGISFSSRPEIGAISNHNLGLIANNTTMHLITPAGVFDWYDGVGGTRMTLNSNGLGVGVTPYVSWPATSKALQLGASSSIEGRTNDGSRTTVYSNTVWNGTNLIYQNEAAAAYYQQAVGVHSWHTNSNTPSAGNTATFTQAMTLDASGRLILLASTTTPATLATNGQLTFTATSDTNLRFSYRGSDGVTRVANITLA